MGDYDIYTATRPDRDSPFSNVANLAELNTSGIDAHPFISPDALSIYFISDRDGEYRENPIFMADRSAISDPFSNIEHLSIFDMTPNIRSECPALSSDGQSFFFSSDGDIYVSYVPEPTTLSLFALGALALLKRRRT